MRLDLFCVAAECVCLCSCLPACNALSKPAVLGGVSGYVDADGYRTSSTSVTVSALYQLQKAAFALAINLLLGFTTLAFTILGFHFLASIFRTLYHFCYHPQDSEIFSEGGPIDGPPFSATISFLVTMRYRCVAFRCVALDPKVGSGRPRRRRSRFLQTNPRCSALFSISATLQTFAPLQARNSDRFVENRCSIYRRIGRFADLKRTAGGGQLP